MVQIDIDLEIFPASRIGYSCRRYVDSLMATDFSWRGTFDNEELNRLHAEAFGHRVFDGEEWDWRQQVADHSLGWVVARDDEDLVGFVNVPWDGLVHAWLQDVMVATKARHRGVGAAMVRLARERAAAAGCEWLHVDFESDLEAFYIAACGFTPTGAGLISLADGADSTA
jgi:GNAT superfamily N-acetyltransferase